MTKAKMGRLITVSNTQRKFGSARFYQAVRVEDADGDNERCLLFTEDEIKDAEERATKNKEDLIEAGFLRDLFD